MHKAFLRVKFILERNEKLYKNYGNNNVSCKNRDREHTVLIKVLLVFSYNSTTVGLFIDSFKYWVQ